MIKNLRKKTKGFTLVEMLIVVIIIGILMYALLGNSGNADKDMMLQQKMDLVAKWFDQCLSDLDNEWLNIEQTKTAMDALFWISWRNPTDTNIWTFVKYPKGKGYNITAFKNSVKTTLWADMGKNTCRDFLNNLENNVGAKWNTQVTYIPAWLITNVDENYGGYLLCAGLSDRKYAEFQDKSGKKYYACAILNLGIGSTGKKQEVMEAFGINDWKVKKMDTTNPKIQN